MDRQEQKNVENTMNMIDMQDTRGINEMLEQGQAQPTVSPRTPQQRGVGDGGNHQRSQRSHLRSPWGRTRIVTAVTAFALSVLSVLTMVAPEQAFAQSGVFISNIGQSRTEQL